MIDSLELESVEVCLIGHSVGRKVSNFMFYVILYIISTQ